MTEKEKVIKRVLELLRKCGKLEESEETKTKATELAGGVWSVVVKVPGKKHFDISYYPDGVIIIDYEA